MVRPCRLCAEERTVRHETAWQSYFNACDTSQERRQYRRGPFGASANHDAMVVGAPFRGQSDTDVKYLKVRIVILRDPFRTVLLRTLNSGVGTDHMRSMMLRIWH
jgi:hypothetical protein